MKKSYIIILFGLLSCVSNDNKILVSNSGEAQGTYYHIKYLSKDAEDFYLKIDSLFAEVDSAVSIYMPNSIISRLNKGEHVRTDTIFNKVYDDAMHVYQLTEGYFDCTVFPLVNYWGFYQNNQLNTSAIDTVLF